MAYVIDKIETKVLNSFLSICSTIGAYIIFPSKKINNKMTINGTRGVNHKIQDRFDLTLECIRRFYFKKNSPLTDTFNRYSTFFNLFQDFKRYVDFFLLQDLVDENYLTIKFWHPFESFDNPPLPKNIYEYNVYRNNLIKYIHKRNNRIFNI